jgi:hypothetical protein
MNMLEARAFEQTRELVAKALKSKLNPNPGDRGPYGPYIAQTFSDKVVYDWNGKMYEAPFEITVDKGESDISLGASQEVMVSYVPVTESDKLETVEASWSRPTLGTARWRSKSSSPAGARLATTVRSYSRGTVRRLS